MKMMNNFISSTATITVSSAYVGYHIFLPPITIEKCWAKRESPLSLYTLSHFQFAVCFFVYFFYASNEVFSRPSVFHCLPLITLSKYSNAAVGSTNSANTFPSLFVCLLVRVTSVYLQTAFPDLYFTCYLPSSSLTPVSIPPIYKKNVFVMFSLLFF